MHFQQFGQVGAWSFVLSQGLSLIPKNRFSPPIWTVVGVAAIQELSTTWWGRVTEEPLGKTAGFSRPFKKKVSSSPFPFTKMGPRLTKRKPYSRRMACVSSTTCGGRTEHELSCPEGVHVWPTGPNQPAWSVALQNCWAKLLICMPAGTEWTGAGCGVA